MNVRRLNWGILLLVIGISWSAQAESILDKLSPEAKEAFAIAQKAAVDRGSAYVSEAHFIYGLLSLEPSDEAGALIRNIPLGRDELLRRAEVEMDLVAKGPAGAHPALGETLKTFLSRDCLETMKTLKDDSLTGDGILMTLLKKRESESGRLFQSERVKNERVLELTHERRGHVAPNNVGGPPRITLTEKGVDLTSQARQGQFSPMVGREDELNELKGAFYFEGGQNFAVVGDRGVGRRTLVRELVRQSTLPGAPPEYADKLFIQIDMSELIAGAKNRGDAEAIANKMIAEVQAAQEAVQAGKPGARAIVLVIDGLEASAGKGDQENSTGEILKIFLRAKRDGKIPGIIATAELTEWKKKIETSSAGKEFEGRVIIKPPKDLEAAEMALEHLGRLQREHRVAISPAAVFEAQYLARRYVWGKPDPQRTLELLEKAAVQFRMSLTQPPYQVQKLEKEIRLKQTELKKMQGAQNPFLARRIVTLTEEIRNMEIEKQSLTREFETARSFKSAVDTERDYLAQLKSYVHAISEGNIRPDTGDLEGYVRGYQAKIAAAEQALAEKQAQLVLYQTKFPSLADDVNGQHLALAASRISGVPIGALMESEAEALLKFEASIKKIVGQNEAKSAIGDAVRNLRLKGVDALKPQTFLFIGAPGTGKTTLVRAMAELAFGSMDALLPLNMSDYPDKASLTRLKGADPGYVGYEEGGKLTEWARTHPAGVIFGDEAEGAGKEVQKWLCTMLEEPGEITDALGRTISFTNHIVVFASNATAQDIKDSKDRKANARFLPEFIDRMDHVIEFKALTQPELTEIFNVKVRPLINELNRKWGVNIEPSIDFRNGLAHMAEAGSGARTLNRLIAQFVEAPVQKIILAKQYHDGTPLKVGDTIHVHAVEEMVPDPDKGPDAQKPVVRFKYTNAPIAGHVSCAEETAKAYETIGDAP